MINLVSPSRDSEDCGIRTPEFGGSERSAAVAVRRHFAAAGMIGAVAALALLFQAANAAADGPEISNFTLRNGLEVVVIPDHRTPVVTHMIWYKVGSADETPGKSGLAHFLEHLMFKGTLRNP